MKSRLFVGVPIGLFFVLLLACAVLPGASGWAEYDAFRHMPHAFFAVALLLGLVFAQNRVVLLSVLAWTVSFLADYYTFGAGNLERGWSVVVLGTIYVPALTAIFYHMPERGLFTANGVARIVILVSTVAAIVLISRLDSFGRAVTETDAPLLQVAGPLLQVPRLGLVVLALCALLLAGRKEHESALLGPFLLLMMLFVFAGLNFRSSLWQAGQARSVLVCFMSGAALTLAWAVLECSWRSANIDELTELPGRRALKRQLAALAGDYAIAMVDVDHFKKINDRYGHRTGDQVLRFIASLLRKSGVGTAYRYGGEEFAVVVQGRQEGDALQELFDLLRQGIADRRFIIRSRTRPKGVPEEPERLRGSGAQGEGITVTVSIGVARWREKHFSPDEVVEAADKALYRAKKTGRNRVVLAR